MAAAVVPWLSGAADANTSAPPGKLQVGCLSWCFHSFGAGADPEEAIDIIGELGFDGVELILNSRRDIQGLWTDDKIDRLKRKLEQHKLGVSQFVLFQPVVEGLSSTSAAVREQNLDFFSWLRGVRKLWP